MSVKNGGMYFPKIRRTREQLEFMIQSILLEYGDQEDFRMIALLSCVYGLKEEDLKESLDAYKAMPEEDFETESNKILYGFI